MAGRVFLWAGVLLLVCQAISAEYSRITFQATPRNIYPVLTKTLQLRCAVQQSIQLSERQAESRKAVFQSMLVASYYESAVTQTVPFSTTVKSISTTPTKAPVSTPVDVSHIVSIIVSRQDMTTGQQVKVASVSTFDPPMANTDLDKITVDGHPNSSPIPGELGYLQITWQYPVSDQSGLYTCDIFAINSTLHSVSISDVVYITASNPNLPELTSIVADNDKRITELTKAISELRNQTEYFQLLNQETATEISNLTEAINNTKAQNIQLGLIQCNGNPVVTFPKPYKSIPQVFTAIQSLSYIYSGDSVTITTNSITTTGFNFVCSMSHTTPQVYWIAIDA